MVKGVDSLGRVVVLTAIVAFLPLQSWQKAALAQPPVITNSETNVHVLKSRAFQFPVNRIDPALQSRTKEISLFMREGPAPGVWKEVATVLPTATKIPCQVPHDGEFSFHVVTTDFQGRPSIAYEDLDKFPPAMTVNVITAQSRPETVYPLVQCKIDPEPTMPQQPSGMPTGRPVFETPNFQTPTFPTRMQDATPTTGATVTKTAQTTAYRAPMASSSSAARLMNTTRVGIDYNVGKAGTSGVSKIDIWMTQDNGRSWQRIGEESSVRKPIQAELPGEGVFGIRLVGTNGNGVGGKPPVSGDTPSMTFEIDLTEPHIHSVEAEPFFRNGIIDIKWKVTDKNLGSEPISLFYASQKSGPGIPIAVKMKNEEVHHWTLPREVPAQFFFRLEAVDMAGNISRYDTPNPLLFDSTVPEIDVTGVQPLQTRSSTGGK
jgi:hypothetical protein